MKSECRFCENLDRERFRSADFYRCPKGRFDLLERIPCYFAWSGIWRPNKTVAAAQKDCPDFKLLVSFIPRKTDREGKE